MVAVDVVLRAPGDASARGGAAPRGVDLRGAVDWDDFAATRWAPPGAATSARRSRRTRGRAELPGHAAWAVRSRACDAIRGRAARGRRGTCAPRAAGVAETEALGDADPDAPPLTVLLAGASARTEQFLLERTAYWSEVVTASPPARGGVHLAFVGPHVDVSTNTSRATSVCRLAPNLTASAHSETAGAYLSRLSPSAPCMVMGFNTGLGGGGERARARVGVRPGGGARRPNTPAAFTCANAFADLAGELGVFRALGARFAAAPAANPFRAYTHAVGEAGAADTDADVRAQASCANAFAYAVLGFEERKGPASGATDDQLRALAAAAAARAAGTAWDALGMER